MKNILIILLLLITTISFGQASKFNVGDTVTSFTDGKTYTGVITLKKDNNYCIVKWDDGNTKQADYRFIKLKYSASAPSKLKPEWHYAPDSNKYIDLVCFSHTSLGGLFTGLGGDINFSQKFDIFVNMNSDSATNKSFTPFLYPIDALNFFAKKGYGLKYIYSVYMGNNKNIEERHYIIEKLKP